MSSFESNFYAGCIVDENLLVLKIGKTQDAVSSTEQIQRIIETKADWDCPTQAAETSDFEPKKLQQRGPICGSAPFGPTKNNYRSESKGRAQAASSVKHR